MSSATPAIATRRSKPASGRRKRPKSASQKVKQVFSTTCRSPFPASPARSSCNGARRASASTGKTRATCSTRSRRKRRSLSRSSTAATRTGSRTNSAISCSSSPISHGISMSTPKRRCAAPTRNSRGASGISKNVSAIRDGSARRALRRWRNCGSRRRGWRGTPRRAPPLPSIPAARPQRFHQYAVYSEEDEDEEGFQRHVLYHPVHPRRDRGPVGDREIEERLREVGGEQREKRRAPPLAAAARQVVDAAGDELRQDRRADKGDDERGRRHVAVFKHRREIGDAGESGEGRRRPRRGDDARGFFAAETPRDKDDEGRARRHQEIAKREPVAGFDRPHGEEVIEAAIGKVQRQEGGEQDRDQKPGEQRHAQQRLEEFAQFAAEPLERRLPDRPPRLDGGDDFHGGLSSPRTIWRAILARVFFRRNLVGRPAAKNAELRGSVP